VKGLAERDPDSEGNNYCSADQDPVPGRMAPRSPVHEFTGACLLVGNHGS
jgi:hypothetical protein